MKRVILICDECKKEEEQKNVVNWLSVNPPNDTTYSLEIDPLPYGLFCSIRCVQRRMDRIMNPKPVTGEVYSLTVGDELVWIPLQPPRWDLSTNEPPGHITDKEGNICIGGDPRP